MPIQIPGKRIYELVYSFNIKPLHVVAFCHKEISLGYKF